MLELKAKQALAQAAHALASSYELIQHNTTTYIPADWLTEEVKPMPDVDRRIWLPMVRKFKMRLANAESNILFATDSELSSFDFMLKQHATEVEETPGTLFVRTPDGLRVLDEAGRLVEPDGLFRPNTLKPMLNTDEAAKKEVFATISEWVGSEKEAHSLLNHIATSLAPGWSPVKYVILLGEGRNGKSLLLLMISDLFGAENVSNISRQQMAEKLPVCVELNNKLVNIVFDGQMDYIKDSGMEKTLIAGEPGYIRMLYESSTTKVQTNALFIEGLNREPKSRDKSSALQKRLVRFKFPNRYALDKAFEKKMRSPEMLGAFLALLIDHYVTQDEVVEKLAPTQGSLALQADQMWSNSPMYQFITQHVLPANPDWVRKVVGTEVDPLITSFMAWRLNEGYNEYSSADVLNMVKELFMLDWKTKRVAGKPSGKVRRIASFKPETEMFIAQYLKEEEEADDAEAVAELVAD